MDAKYVADVTKVRQMSKRYGRCPNDMTDVHKRRPDNSANNETNMSRSRKGKLEKETTDGNAHGGRDKIGDSLGETQPLATHPTRARTRPRSHAVLTHMHTVSHAHTATLICTQVRLRTQQRSQAFAHFDVRTKQCSYAHTVAPTSLCASSNAHTHARTLTCAHNNAHTRTHSYTHVPMRMQQRSHAFTRFHMRTQQRSHAPTFPYARSNVHTHSHAFTRPEVHKIRNERAVKITA